MDEQWFIDLIEDEIGGPVPEALMRKNDLEGGERLGHVH